MIRPTDTDFGVCQVSFETLLEIQLEAHQRGWATRGSSTDALRSQVEEGPIVLQSLIREVRDGAVRSYRCLALFPAADGNSAGGLATIDVAPARWESLKRLNLDPDVSRAFAQLFTFASGRISMIAKA